MIIKKRKIRGPTGREFPYFLAIVNEKPVSLSH